MKLHARMAAPIKDVHHALTDAGSLRIWLAEHAEVDLPHRYAFWGRDTPEGDAPHQRPLHVDDRTLRFSWLLDGEDTTVEIRLAEESPDSTVLTLSQSHFDYQEMITGSSIRGVLETYWSLAIANLADHLEGRELTPRPDFTSPELKGEFIIDASPEAVFDSLVDSEKVSRWFNFPIEIEPQVGGRYALGGFDAGHAAKIIDLDPGRAMTVDWGDSGVTTWELEGSGGGTRLTFVQSGFDTGRPPYAGWMGWLSGIAELRRFHELDGWRPIWLDADAAEGAAAAG
ncbi:SRPBCC domain-containing protein [Streptosporangium sp. NBC_01756]|uniref:SRPBCC domain-containing protein n=1 Tax=Streptosporangium sp. NBC_01756 TaxID=2975950 RepID=UPI002DD9AC9B|nr:SRPBCC domain-containing protein [Streptosporangium sp. NBC_01756]WSC83100.1 SRPBCC domain-containing protein [Streptosporangium sp. NBC_01756]